MEILAYAIWGALGGCLVIGVLVFVYARLHARYDDSASVEIEEPQTEVAGINPGRWEQLVAMLNLHTCTLPEGEEERMAWAQEYLGVEPEWLAGEDVPMYPFLSFNNAVDQGVDFISTLVRTRSDAVLYVAKPRGILLAEEIMDACAALCFAAPVSSARCNSRRYFPVNVYWEWGYAPERVQCSQIIYAAIEAGLEIKGVEVEQGEIYALVEGKRIPATVLENTPSSWDPRILASAGEGPDGVRKGMLAAQELMEIISAQGWNQGKEDKA
ncbi:MAG: hypothetical protein ABR516_02925 [Desulfuromonadaceae bacterium]